MSQLKELSILFEFSFPSYMIHTLEIFSHYDKRIKLPCNCKGAAELMYPSNFGAFTVEKYLGIKDALEGSGLNVDIITHLHSLDKSSELCEPKSLLV